MTDNDMGTTEVLSNSDNLNIMRGVINSFGDRIPESEREDIMHLAAARCLAKYDSNFGQKFTTSLHRYTQWTCFNFLRSQKKLNRSNKPILLSNLTNIPSRVSPDEENIKHIHECMHMLNDVDRELIHQHFMMNMTFREIALYHSYTRMTAMNKVRKATDRLRRICLSGLHS